MSNIVLLLELTGDGLINQDMSTLRTFEDMKVNKYYKQLENIEIYDTQSDINRTLSLLDDLYKKGKRIFIGFSRSKILTDVIDWFKKHDDVYGISLTSTSPTLNIKKNILRMIPPDNKIIDTYLYYLNRFSPVQGGFKKILILYQDNDIFSKTLTELLFNNIDKDRIILYNINKKKSTNNFNLIVDDFYNIINELLNSYYNDEIIVINNIVDKFDDYINFINNNLSNNNVVPHLSNIGENPPNITNKLYINKYKHISFLPNYESFISKYVNNNNYSDILYDVINISYYINNTINDYKYITGSYGYLYFDENNDRNLINFAIFNFNDLNNWKPLFKYNRDPIYGDNVSFYMN